MEGLDHGWKKSIHKYHFYDRGSLSSVCDTANFNYSIHKDNEFLTEIELTNEMDICKVCYRARQDTMKKKIIEAKKDNGFWDDTKKCPNCKKSVIFWNSNKDKAHTCTICDTVVMLT